MRRFEDSKNKPRFAQTTMYISALNMGLIVVADEN
jgi:hypothetical protein